MECKSEQAQIYKDSLYNVSLAAMYNSILLHIRCGEMTKALKLSECACYLIDGLSGTEISPSSSSIQVNKDKIKMAMTLKYTQGCIYLSENLNISSNVSSSNTLQVDFDLYQAMDYFQQTILIGKVHVDDSCFSDNHFKWLIAKAWSNIAYCSLLSGDSIKAMGMYQEACDMYNSFRGGYRDSVDFCVSVLFGEDAEEQCDSALTA